MIEIDPNKFIDITMVEGAEQDGSIFILHMISGRTVIVSPAVFTRVVDTKKNLDSVKTEMAF